MPPEDFLAQHQLERDSLDTNARKTLLKDQSSGQAIIWATDDYRDQGEDLGDHFRFGSAIFPYALFENNSSLILPRVLKNSAQKVNRTRRKAEVFTPSWVCNRQNNLVDEAWFGRPDVFNQVTADGWTASPGKIAFPNQKGKTWEKYVDARRLEIACGEAPYLASRYDTVSGQRIDVLQRIGLLDRKLRVVGENTNNSKDWFFWALRAVEACYGYEWQGDSLFLARENLLLTVMDYYQDRFGTVLYKEQQRQVAYRLSWNLWQMDALRYVIPGTCHEETVDTLPTQLQIAEKHDQIQTKKVSRSCPGCQDPRKSHNGVHCTVKDWRSKVTHKYIDLFSAVLKNSRLTATGEKIL